MTPIEIIAVAFAVIVLVKALVYLISPKALMEKGSKLMKMTWFMHIFYIVLLVAVGYYVFDALGIVNVLAVMFFAHVIIGMLFVQYPKQWLNWAKALLKDKVRVWLFFLVYIILAGWGLYAVFM